MDKLQMLDIRDKKLITVKHTIQIDFDSNFRVVYYDDTQKFQQSFT